MRWLLESAKAQLEPLIDKVWGYCETSDVRGRTVRLKVKYADFQTITPSRSAYALISDRATLANLALELLAAIFPIAKGVRLIGVSLSSLSSAASESVRKHQAGLQSFRSMRRIEARRRNASALRLRFSQSLASLRHRLSQAMVRSTIQRLGSTTNPLA
jgi:hypothetical protein